MERDGEGSNPGDVLGSLFLVQGMIAQKLREIHSLVAGGGWQGGNAQLFAAGRTMVGARFIVHSAAGGRGIAEPLPSAALRRPEIHPTANR